ncbi:hypothetical protein TYRP_021470 [Tyrophagus putrescentiae]|nr:hypothetical protein TYRP_021470 [Tyrophagus putrescentiae]
MAAAKQLNFQVMRINHKEKVTEALESMFIDEALTDVTICCCGQQVKAHRVILAASSNYFKEIFAATLPGQYPIVFIKSVSIEDLNAILEFIYKGEVTVPRDQMESLVSSAECLGVLGLGNMDLDECPNLKHGRPIRPELQQNALVNGSSAASSPSRSDVNCNEGPKNDDNKAGISTMPKKRGKKRKIGTAEEEQNQKEAKASSSKKTNGHSNGDGVHSSSPQSTSSSSSASQSTRKSAQSQASTSSIANGHHKVASVSSKRTGGPLSEPMDDAEDEATDEENIKEEASESSSSTQPRKNTMTLKMKSKRMNGYRTRGEVQEQQLPHSRNSTPSIDSDVEVEISGQYGSSSKGDEQHRTSNGSLDLSRKSATTGSKLAGETDGRQSRESTPVVASSKDPSTSSSSSTPGSVKTIVTKSKLRSWSQQISQSAGPVGEQTPLTTTSPGPKGLSGLSKSVPQINLAAIKNEINEQLAAASGSSSPSTPNGPSPNVFSAKAMTSTTPVDEEKPVITLPPHIKMEARPRGRPRKAITEKAAIVPRPLNPLLGLARSSLAAKVAKAAASASASKESSAEPASVDRPSPISTPSTPASTATTTSAPATPVPASSASVSDSATSSPSSEVANEAKCTSESTPTVPVMRVSRISPSSSHTVTIVNGSGDIVSTVTAGGGGGTGSSTAHTSSPHSPALSSASSSSSAHDLYVEQTPPLMTTAGGSSTSANSSSSAPVVKKRRGRPPSIAPLANLKHLSIQPKQEPRVPSLTLKIPNKFASIFKSNLNAGGNFAASSSSSKPLHQSSSVISGLFGGGSSSSTPTFTPAFSASIPSSSNNPSSSAHAPVQPRPSSAQSMATISSDSLAGGHRDGQEFSVPRFIPIVASSSSATAAATSPAVATATAAAKESAEKGSEPAAPETAVF